MREIEIKLKVKNREELLRALTERGCVLSEKINQHDTIYSHPTFYQAGNQMKEGAIVTRIRQQDDRTEFTLKQQQSHELDNNEYELAITDPVTMDKILKVLGFYPTSEVKKIRQTGKLEDYTVCLDQVEKLGNFIELEKLTDDTIDPVLVEEELFHTLESLGLSRNDQIKKGYDTLMFELDSQN